jgi:hypothetical protein
MDQDFDYDVGAVILDNPLPCGEHFGLCTLDTAAIESIVLHIAGFPMFQQPEITPDANLKRELVYAAGLTKALDRNIMYDFFGGHGSSGSPIWVRTGSGHRLVVAIHHRREQKDNKLVRYGLRVSNELLLLIRSWIAEAE